MSGLAPVGDEDGTVRCCFLGPAGVLIELPAGEGRDGSPVAVAISVVETLLHSVLDVNAVFSAGVPPAYLNPALIFASAAEPGTRLSS